MITKEIKRIYALGAICCILSGLFLSCQDSEWDNYYSPVSISDVTLMQAIDANSDLSCFAGVVRKNGLDKLLSSSQTFTVFAPTNDAMSSYVANGDQLNEFLNNHICRYIYSLGDVEIAEDSLLRIKMLNGKYQNLSVKGNNLVFGNQSFITSIQGTSNGVLNTISDWAPFYNNIYEELKRKGGETDSIANYLMQFDEQTFLPEQSTIIGSNERDETVYDSVFLFRNDWMSNYGDIYLEDSVYTMLVPTNKAWTEQYNRVKEYFRAYGQGELRNPASGLNITGSFATNDKTADSLTRVHTKEAMTMDLVFRRHIDVQHPDGDSIVSTSQHTFHAPQYLFDDADYRGVSNGKLYVTDNLKFRPSESWHQEIRVEAEQSENYATQYASSTQTINVLNYPQFTNMVSENGFLIINPTQLSFQKTTVRFRLPATLSAAYNIYVQTVPASAQDTSLIGSESLRSTRLKFYLRYVHEDGTLKEDAAITTPVDYAGTQTPTPIDSETPPFITDAKNVNKMLIARNFRFPYANYSVSAFQSSSVEIPVTAFLRVETDVTSASALATFEKIMRIDCIILEPVEN